jgi:hypothetical protein
VQALLREAAEEIGASLHRHRVLAGGIYCSLSDASNPSCTPSSRVPPLAPKAHTSVL